MIFFLNCAIFVTQIAETNKIKKQTRKYTLKIDFKLVVEVAIVQQSCSVSQFNHTPSVTSYLVCSTTTTVDCLNRH